MSNLQKASAIKQLFDRDDVKHRFQEILGKNSSQFLTSVLSAVQSNGYLSDADPMSIMMASATAATLNLPVNPNLGFCYLIPYNVKQKDGTYKKMCQFQIGYKGFIQLCQRTGLFKHISAAKVYEGQLIENNPLTGCVFDWTNALNDNVIGYAAYFELTTGYRHTLYMSVQDIERHGSRFSKTFKDKSGVWQSDFDAMAIKTVLKQLLTKYAPMSSDYLQLALVSDQGIVRDFAGTVDYPDNSPDLIDSTQVARTKEIERLKEALAKCTNVDEVDDIIQQVFPDEELEALCGERRIELVTSGSNE